MKSLNLRADMFYIPYFNERLDIVQDPLDFLTWEPRPNTLHLLQYHILFPPEYVVGYFRTINFTTMFQQFEGSARASSLASRVDFILRNEFSHMVRSQLRVLLSDYFVLEISRQDPLKETLDQLWGQEKRMLLKPLKVRMGMDEGEVGLDQGGVTYEFFGLVLGEAFNPDNGELQLTLNMDFLLITMRHVHLRLRDQDGMVSACLTRASLEIRDAGNTLFVSRL